MFGATHWNGLHPQRALPPITAPSNEDLSVGWCFRWFCPQGNHCKIKDTRVKHVSRLNSAEGLSVGCSQFLKHILDSCVIHIYFRNVVLHNWDVHQSGSYAGPFSLSTPMQVSVSCTFFVLFRATPLIAVRFYCLNFMIRGLPVTIGLILMTQQQCFPRSRA